MHGRRKTKSILTLTGLRLRKYIAKGVRFHIAGEAKSAVYDRLVLFDDKSM